MNLSRDLLFIVVKTTENRCKPSIYIYIDIVIKNVTEHDVIQQERNANRLFVYEGAHLYRK